MQIIRSFRRQVPEGQAYQDRLNRELELIKKYNFEQTFLQVREILDLTTDIPHITRGSAGCSLVAFLLGIHDLDPVKNNFALSRFMHENRPDLPDIDIDFPYNRRDEVIERVKQKYPNRVARISNHVNYQSNSALRQAIRETGFNKFLPKHFDQSFLGSRLDEVSQRAKELEGTFRNYSLHCGGIVIFPDKIPDELKLDDNQIKLNKDQVEDQKMFKIDLLCNRALAQLTELSKRPLDEYPETDELTSKMFQTGNSWGVTFAESPAQRKLHKEIQPRSRKDIILSLALIRPLPSADGRRTQILEQLHDHNNHDGHLVYDDDGIRFIQNLLNCSESQAEIYRKAFGKQKTEIIEEFTNKIKLHPDKDKVLKELNYFSLYSFCHAHATSYGNLVWALAYEKTRQPHKFWEATLNHTHSMYRPWVYVQEAKKAGLTFANFGKAPWKLVGTTIFSQEPEHSQDGWAQYHKRGYWISNRFMPNCFQKKNFNKIKFRGLIATGRHHTVNNKQITFVTIGTNTGVYLDLIIEGIHQFDKYDIVEGEGLVQNQKSPNIRLTLDSVKVKKYNFVKLKAPTNQLMLFNE